MRKRKVWEPKKGKNARPEADWKVMIECEEPEPCEKCLYGDGPSRIKWRQEVYEAFRNWKRNACREYKRFVSWNSYHREKYFASKETEENLTNPIMRILT